MYPDEKNDMKNGLYSIGVISEVTGLSVSAIRYYSETGLIVPSYIDESTGYRYFSSRHVWKLEIIKMYKQLGFSLEAILELQETKRLDVLEQIIDKSEQSVRKKIEEYNETLANLNWLKEQCNIFRQTKSEDGFIIRTIPERKVLYMTCKIRYRHMGFCNAPPEENNKRAANAENHSEMLRICFKKQLPAAGRTENRRSVY